jgi:hypothetical protein
MLIQMVAGVGKHDEVGRLSMADASTKSRGSKAEAAHGNRIHSLFAEGMKNVFEK